MLLVSIWPVNIKRNCRLSAAENETVSSPDSVSLTPSSTSMESDMDYRWQRYKHISSNHCMMTVRQENGSNTDKVGGRRSTYLECLFWIFLVDKNKPAVILLSLASRKWRSFLAESDFFSSAFNSLILFKVARLCLLLCLRDAAVQKQLQIKVSDVLQEELWCHCVLWSSLM